MTRMFPWNRAAQPSATEGRQRMIRGLIEEIDLHEETLSSKDCETFQSIWSHFDRTLGLTVKQVALLETFLERLDDAGDT